MDLLDDDDLARSAVVANCRMNRERGLTGSNGYARELGFAPLDRRTPGRPWRWLDLCCGSGRALVEAAELLHDQTPGDGIVGVDLVGPFPPAAALDPRLRLVEASVATWTPAPGATFDLITSVHGLHYVGDKLGLITRALGWLAAGGMFAATLDLSDIRLVGVPHPARHLRASFRRAGLDYDPRRRLIRAAAAPTGPLPYRYVGADDSAGPNFTGQPAVASVYEVVALESG